MLYLGAPNPVLLEEGILKFGKRLHSILYQVLGAEVQMKVARTGLINGFGSSDGS